MSHIPTPATIADAPEGSQDLLKGVEKMLGSAPNGFRLISNSPAALEGYLGLSGALGKGELSPATRERLALAIANHNGCDYCNSAHTYVGTNVAKLDEAEIIANREGKSMDAKADVAVRFALKVAQTRGQVEEQEIAEVRAAGYSDGELVEIVSHVAANVFTNYMFEVFDVDVDFPLFKASRAA